MATKNIKYRLRRNRFHKLDHIRRWGMSFVIWVFVLPYSLWLVANTYSDQTQNLSHDNKSQTEAVKGSAETIKKTKNIARSGVPLEIQMRRELNANLVLEASAHIDKTRRDEHTQITRKQGNTKEASTGKSSSDDHTQIVLLFHNNSYRNTAVIDVYVRQGENILGGKGYKNRIKLPIRVKAKGNNKVKFPMEKDDLIKMTDIFIRDREDNEYICTIRIQKCINKNKTSIRQKG